LTRPIIGHTADGALILDFRCLADEDEFVSALSELGGGRAFEVR
jgi:hypothetical protein